MPLIPTIVPPFPSVTPQPGVPALGGQGYQQFTQTASQVSLLASDVGTIAALFDTPQWGIFDQSGNAIATWDNVVSVDYRHEMRISDFPVEQGGFQSYNKVKMPYDARVQFSIGSGGNALGLGGAGLFGIGGGGGADGRTALLTAIEAAVVSLDLYTVVTPEATYSSANLVHMDYRREARGGINLLVVDVWLEEVRATASVQSASQQGSVNDPQSPTAAPANNNGSTQSVPVTVSEPESAPLLGGTTPTSIGQDNMPTLGASAGDSLPPAQVPAAVPTGAEPYYATPMGAPTGVI